MYCCNSIAYLTHNIDMGAQCVVHIMDNLECDESLRGRMVCSVCTHRVRKRDGHG